MLIILLAFFKEYYSEGFPAYGPYIASKAGLEGLVRLLANELRGRNITVNAAAQDLWRPSSSLPIRQTHRLKSLANCPLCNASASRKTLPTLYRSLPARTAAGSTSGPACQWRLCIATFS